MFGDLTRANASRLSRCLEHALETHAERVILDLGGLDRLDPEAVSPILIAHLTADSEHRQFLLRAASDSVQYVLDRVQGPFSYLVPDDDSLLRVDLAWGVRAVGRPAEPGLRRRMLDRLLGSIERLIVATEHAPEPIRTLEYAGGSALLGVLELWLAVDRGDESTSSPSLHGS